MNDYQQKLVNAALDAAEAEARRREKELPEEPWWSMEDRDERWIVNEAGEVWK